MANVNRVSGFKLVGTHSGAAFSQTLRQRDVAVGNPTAIMPGDAVKNVDADGSVVKATAGDESCGICVGVVPDPAVTQTFHPGYLPATTVGKILVADSADYIFEVQEDGVGGALTAAAIGSNVDLIDAGPDTTMGKSGQQLDSSTVSDAGPGSAQFRLLGPVIAPDNEVGSAYCRWHVVINEHALKNLTGI